MDELADPCRERAREHVLHGAHVHVEDIALRHARELRLHALPGGEVVDDLDVLACARHGLPVPQVGLHELDAGPGRWAPVRPWHQVEEAERGAALPHPRDETGAQHARAACHQGPHCHAALAAAAGRSRIQSRCVAVSPR